MNGFWNKTSIWLQKTWNIWSISLKKNTVIQNKDIYNSLTFQKKTSELKMASVGKVTFKSIVSQSVLGSN